MILKKYGHSLKEMILRHKKKRFSIKSCVQIGIQLLRSLETLHNHGFVHNNLKPRSVLLKSSDFKELDSSQLVLIDFAHTQRYQSGQTDTIIS